MKTLTTKKSQADAQTRAAMRWLCERDLFYLVKVVLNADRPVAENKIGELHRDLCQYVQTTPHRDNLYLVARGHLKTSFLTVGRNIQRLLQNPQVRILIASNKSENAEAMLSEIKGHLESPLLTWLYPDILWPDPARQAERWTTSAITVKRKRRTKEATIETIGVTGELTSKHYDHGSFDDVVGKENSETRDLREGIKQFVRISRSLFDPGATRDWTGCLPSDAEVLMHDGTAKPIESIKAGDRVWAADEDGSLAVRTVTALVPQGEHRTLTIQTATKTIRATPNHPFLVCRAGGPRWRRADELERGDYVVSIKEIPGQRDYPWMTEDFVWLFGFLMGDGWASVSGHRGHVGIAMSKYADLNDRVLSVAREWLRGGDFHVLPMGHARSESRADAEALQELGLVGGAKGKRLPEWAFRLPPALRRSLLRGFCEADGFAIPRSTDSFRVEIANRGLIEDLRRIADLSGVRTGRLAFRRRVVRAPNSPQPTVSETWSSSFNFSTVDRDEFLGWERGAGRPRVPPLRAAMHAGLRPETIVSVTPNAAPEMVYDLTVDGTPSFFANGLAVHNTPWHYDDAYAWLLELQAQGSPIGTFIRPCWVADPQGVEVPGYGRVRLTFPEKWSVEELLAVRKEKGPSEFAAQYLIDPVPADTAYFPRTKAVLRPRSEFPPLDTLWNVMAVDPAISQKKWADFSAIVVVGWDQDGKAWVTDIRRGKWAESETVAQIYDAYERVTHRGGHVASIGFEAIGFAKIFSRIFTAEGERRNFYLPVTKLERDTNAAKNTRIRALEPLWASGDVIFASDIPQLAEFLDEADRFRPDRESAHDDMLDALADTIQLRVKPDAKPKEYLVDDPEIAERIDFEERIIRQRREAKAPPLDRTELRSMFNHQRRRAQWEAEREMVTAGDEW